MRRTDDLIDPEIAAELDAIDATLAGDPVDPRHAEVAELALLLASDRPEPRADFGRALDDRARRRFVAEASDSAARARDWSPRLWIAPLGGLVTAGVAALVAVVVLGSSGGSHPSSRSTTQISASGAAATPAVGLPHRTASGGGSQAAPGSASGSSQAAPGSVSASSSHTLTPFAANTVSAASSASSRASATHAPAPQPAPNGRKIIQSAQLALSASSNQIDTVAQEIFDVVGREKGVVNSSQVTAGTNGYADFQLSVPSSALATTMTSLSQLAHATVTSRTDATQDVNGQYLADQRTLADARALRTSLLKQLANATTQQQITSLTARLHDAEASIRSDEATLRDLNHKIGFSQISVTINGAVVVAPAHRHSGSFTLGKAAHDAGRVLTVAAGIALITLAALTPVVLIGALGWWLASSIRRRRREQALDLA